MPHVLSAPYNKVLLILSCLFLVVASARIEFLHWLSFIALLPLAFLLQNLKPRQAIVLTTLCATLFWMATSYWLVPANIGFSESNPILVVVIFVVFCLWQALPYVFLAACYSFLQWQQSVLGPLLAAGALTLAWVILPSPLPWLPINSLYTWPKFVAVLDLSGLSLLLFLSSFYCFALQYISRKDAPFKKSYLIALLLIPCVMLSYGQLRQWQMNDLKKHASPEQWLNVGYIQPVLHYTEKFDRAYQLTEQLNQTKHPELIVWPEISVPYSFTNNRVDRDKTLALVRQYQQDLLVVSGYVYSNQMQDGRRQYFNQAQLIKDTHLQGRYSKEILVPFFEYLPAPLHFLRPLMPKVLYYQAGENQQPIQYKDAVKLAVVICYEVIFPDYVRQQIHKGANILINPSSDAAFGGGIGSYYHLATAYFRSIENRVPWVRATNTGISVIVGMDGRELTQASQINAVSTDSAKVYLPKQASIYNQFGDWFSKLLILLGVIYLWLDRKTLIKAAKNTHAPKINKKTKSRRAGKKKN